MKFKTGDVVRLKSGGPAMTVNSYDNDKILSCDWFVNFEVKSARFNEDQLDKEA